MKYLSRPLIAVGGFMLVWPTFVWMQAPGLTQMQILQENWLTYLIGGAILTIGLWVEFDKT